MSSCNNLSRKTAGTPLGAIGRGLIAGAVGSLAMDVLWYARYRRGGGKQHFFAWEFSSGLSSWEEAPVPGQVGKRLFEGLFQKKLPPQRAELVSNITHWAYGMLNGALYGIAAESLGQPRTWYGAPVRRRRMGRRLRGPPGRRAVQADPGLRPRNPGQGPHRPPRLRDHHRRRSAAPVTLDQASASWLSAWRVDGGVIPDR